MPAGVGVIPAGVAAIVPRIIPVAGVEYGINGIIAEPAVVIAMTAGPVMIALKLCKRLVVIMLIG